MIENRDIQKDLKQIDTILKEQGISRRDAMKMMGIGSLSALMMDPKEVQANTNPSDVKGKVVIIGAGLSGISTAARLTQSLINPDVTIIDPNAFSASYQPGQTLVASGIWKKREIIYRRDDYIPKAAKVIKEKVANIDANSNTVILASGKKIAYDFLVVAAGVTLNYGAIKGLEEVGEVYSSGENSKLLKILDSLGASSIYTANSAEVTWVNMQKFIASAKMGKKVKGVFTHPNTPIKCESAPKNIMYLTNARLEEVGAKANADLHFYPDGKTMFDIKDYNDAIIKQYEARAMKYSYNHNLIEVKNGIAIFDHHTEVKGIFDAVLGKYNVVTNHENVEVPFDFLHITPPMKAPDEIGNSSIGSKTGWIPVNKETLQHLRYKNVFALGDIANLPMGKTAGSVRKQYKVVVNNIISMMEKGEIPISNQKYDGYTVCPLITNIGTVMLAQFNWASQNTDSGKDVGLLPFLDPTQERYIWWLLEVYLLKPLTQYGILAGRV